MTLIVTLADGPGFTGFLTDFNTTFWSAMLRISEALVAAAPFLVAGVFAAGILRGMIGADYTRRILGVDHWTGPFRAWALGVLLPICSLGALPVARELRRAGIPSGTVLSFVLVAPVLNPVSIMFGLSHIHPQMLIYFAIGTFVVSVGIGLIWNRFVSQQKDVVSDEYEVAPKDSIHRLAVVGDTVARGLVGPVFVDFLLALFTVGFLGAFLPYGILQTGLTRENPFSPVIMGLVAIPVYVTPTDVMMHFGHIVQDGYSLGAAFALIVLGAGANVGVANWLRRDYGAKPLLLFVSLLIGSTLVIGLTADRTIVHGNAGMKDHTHAFDPFTRLANVDDEQAGFGWVVSEISKNIRTDEVVSLGILGIILIVGGVLSLMGERVSVEKYLNPARGKNELTTPDWNPALSARQLTIVGILGSLTFTVMGIYLYYPSPENLIADIGNIRVNAYEAVMEEDPVEAKRRLDQWRGRVEKLPTSLLIRFGTVTDEHHESVADVMRGLDSIERYVESGKYVQAKLMKSHVEKQHLKCSQLFRSASQ